MWYYIKNTKSVGVKSIFLGLLDWVCNIKSNNENLISSSIKVIRKRYSNSKIISVQGEEPVGKISLEKISIGVELTIDSQEYSESINVYEGFQQRR